MLPKSRFNKLSGSLSLDSRFNKLSGSLSLDWRCYSCDWPPETIASGGQLEL